MMYIVEFSSNGFGGKLYANQCGPAVTSEEGRAYRFVERSAAVAEAKELATSEDLQKLAGASDVCWQVRQV